MDIGANVGEFTRTFLSEFPDCIPTLVGPNPHCQNHLKSLSCEVIYAAASDKDGTAEIYLSKEWLESTGASLYRENTIHFRDEIVAKEMVNTVRLNSFLEGRSFDFIKIDVQGGELDVLNGGTELIRRADYVLIEVPIVEYNSGAPPAERIFEKLKTMGFKCAEAVEFHRLGSVLNGNLLQMDFLFERIIPRATQNYRYAKFSDVSPTILQFLKTQKAESSDFSVLNVGDAAAPWAAEVFDATFDMNAGKAAPIHFSGNFNHYKDWDPVLNHVSKNGNFSYSVCAHTLEDIAFPALALEMLPCISEAGYICVSSKYLELIRREGPYRGYIHHRWIFCLNGGQLVLVPKIAVTDFMTFANEEKWFQNPDRWELHIHWQKGIQFTVLNNDYLGPSVNAVIQMYTDILAGQEE